MNQMTAYWYVVFSASVNGWQFDSYGRHHTFPDPLNSEENDLSNELSSKLETFDIDKSSEH